VTGPSLARIGIATLIGGEPKRYRYYTSVERAQVMAIELRMYFGTVRVEARATDGGWQYISPGPMRRAARAVDLRRLADSLRRRGEHVTANWLAMSAKYVEDLGLNAAIPVEPALVEMCDRAGITLMTAVTPSGDRAVAS